MSNRNFNDSSISGLESQANCPSNIKASGKLTRLRNQSSPISVSMYLPSISSHSTPPPPRNTTGLYAVIDIAGHFPDSRRLLEAES